MATIDLTNITPPRVPLTDQRTGLISREWYRFFFNVFQLTGNGQNTTSLSDLQVEPLLLQQGDLTNIVSDVEANKFQPTQESALDQIAELTKQVEALSVLPLNNFDGAAAALTRVNDTNVTLTLGGAPTTALLAATSLTLGWTGQLAVTRGGTGTLTAFTTGAVVFAGASGVYSQDSANFFWDATNVRLGIGNATPTCTLDITGGVQTSRTAVTAPATTDGNIFSGTYTPTQVLTNTNVDSVTFSACQYMRVGDTITVSGQLVIDATTATTDTVVKMTIPVTSNFTSSRQLAGVGSSISSPYAANNLVFLADATNDSVDVRLRPSVNTSLTYNFSFTYRVL